MLPSPYLNLNRPDHGDFPDNWEIPVNANWDIIDAVFHGTRSDSGGTGHIHNGADGQGPQIDHDDLLNKGTKTHADLDSESGKVFVSAADTLIDFLQNKLVPGANITINLLNPGVNEQLEIEASALTPTLGDPTDPSGAHGWRRFTPTSAPIAYTDNFTYQNPFKIKDGNYVSDEWTDTSAEFTFISTGYAAKVISNPANGYPTKGRYCSTVLSQWPHSIAQRATCAIADVDYDNMKAGDFIAFTLGVLSTHTLGPNLPQKYGVMLELHLVKLTDSPDTFQFSHRVVIIPDDITQVQLASYSYSDPTVMRGSWEIAVDGNGHIYAYFRRNLIYSSQGSPPTATGPLMTYLPALLASLSANGDPVYGAMGMGCQYDISAESDISLEVRWLSVCGTDDLYYEVASLTPTPLPTPIPAPTHIKDDEYWATPRPKPGAIPDKPCCPAPWEAIGRYPTRQWQLGGVWTVACCTAVIQNPSTGAPERWPGYLLDTGDCVPCPYQIGIKEEWDPTDPEPPWFDPGQEKYLDDPYSNPWVEGTDGGIFMSGISPIPPNCVLESSNPNFQIYFWEWESYERIFFRYRIAEGSAGETVTLTIYNPDEQAATQLVLTNIITIEAAVVTVDGLSFKNNYYGGTAANPFTKTEYEVTVSGSGFTIGTSFTSALGVISSTTIVDWNTARLTILYGAVDGTETITAIKGSFTAALSTQVLVKSPEFAGGTIDGVVGAGNSANIKIPFLTTTPTVVENPPGAVLANIAGILYNPLTHIVSFDFDVAGIGQARVLITDPDTTEDIIVPLLTAGGGTNPTITTVSTNITPYEGRVVTVTVNGNFDFDHYVNLGGPLLTGPNEMPGGLKLQSVSPTQIVFQIKIDTGGFPGPVDVIVTCPEVPVTPARQATSLAAFTTLDVPVLAYTLAAWSGGLTPGASGTMTFTGTGITDQAGEIVIESDSSLVSFTGPVSYISPTQFSIPYTVDSEANGEGVNLVVTQALDGQSVAWLETLGLQAPIITRAVPIDGEYLAPLRSITIRGTGTNFDPGAVVTGSGWVVTGFVIVSGTEFTADVTCPGASGPVSLSVTNPDGQIGTWNGACPATPDVDPFHMESGVLQSGVQVSFYLYGEWLNPVGLAIPEADSIDVTLRTYIEGKITPVGAPGTPVTVTFTSTGGGPWGPFEIGIITAAPPVPTVTGVSELFPKEYTNYPALEINGTNLSVVDHLYILPDIGEEVFFPLEFWPPPWGAGLAPVVVNSIVSKIDPKIVIDVNFGELLAYRKFHISLRDAGGVEIGTSAPGTFWVEAFDTAVPLANETVAYPQIITLQGANYLMTVPIISAVLNLPGDVWSATNATINSQVWNGVDSWILDITNGTIPPLNPGDPVELRLTRPDAPYLGIPPYGSVLTYELV